MKICIDFFLGCACSNADIKNKMHSHASVIQDIPFKFCVETRQPFQPGMEAPSICGTLFAQSGSGT